MKQIILTVDDSFPLIELCGALRQMGCILRRKQDGSLAGYQISPERHGNGNVVTMPWHRKQYRAGALPPPGPEVA